MGSAVFTEAILIIASVIIAGSLAGVAMSKAGGFQSVFTETSENQKKIVLTKIKIIYATNSSSTAVNVWAKNIGVTPIAGLQSLDVYFGPVGSVQKIPYNSGSPSWTFSNPIIMWNATNTIQLTISNNPTLQNNIVYELQLTTPNGVSDQYFLSVP